MRLSQHIKIHEIVAYFSLKINVAEERYKVTGYLLLKCVKSDHKWSLEKHAKCK